MIVYPFVWYFGSYAKAGIGEKPLIFHNPLFILVGNLIVWAFIAISIYLLFVSWKTLLLLFALIVLAGYLKGLFYRIKYHSL